LAVLLEKKRNKKIESLLDRGFKLDILDIIRGRRSIRKYKTDSVPKDLIEKILEAGRWAPSAGNVQPWEFIVINDRKILDLVRKFSPGFFGDAPLAILICSNKERARKFRGSLGRDLAIIDCAMAAQNILLTAYALGLGSCPIKSFSQIAIREILEIPDHLEPELLIAIGYPDQKPPPPPKRPLSEMVHLNKYGVKWKNMSEQIEGEK